MKEKILKIEKVNVKTETVKDETKTETKTESSSHLGQETICSNINDLSGALSSLAEIEGTVLEKDLCEKLHDTKENIINGLYILSKNLITEDPV